MRQTAAMTWRLRHAVAADADWIAELRAVVMRPDLERLGRFDPDRVRARFRDGFHPSWTHVIEVDGSAVGCVAVRPAPDATWLEHFYLAPAHQGHGLGTAVLCHVLAQAGAGVPLRLNVLQGSPARTLYERHGFTVEREDPVDVWMVRGTPHQAASA